MDYIISATVLITLLFVFLAGGLWVALSLLSIGFLGIVMFSGAPAGLVLATTVWGSSASWTLTALPLFVWMGEILFRTRLSEDMFKGLAPWMSRIPGRLMHVNIVGCGIFAAVSGSSAATAMTIGKMSLPELSKRGYDERMSIGTLAGSGTLGLLIPPSIILIVYGVQAEISIARLFIAGVLPGLLLILLFMGYVVVWALLNRDKTPAAEMSLSFVQKLYAARRLIPVLLLISFVIGSIYRGWATATEAAAFGVAGALFLSLVSGSLNWESFKVSLLGATRTSCMIAFILAGAAFLTVAMGYTRIPATLAQWIQSLELSPYVLLFALTIFFIVLGCFLDGISVVVLGIYVVLVVEMSQITPPVGFNLFVLQGLTGRNILYIAKTALPFFLLLVLAVAIIIAFPSIATYLPSVMTAR